RGGHLVPRGRHCSHRGAAAGGAALQSRHESHGEGPAIRRQDGDVRMTAQTPAPEPVLRVTGLRKYYGDQLALDGVDLEVHDSEVVAVLGPSGSGKSTLVRCIDQLESIDGGAMHLDGELLGYEQNSGRL